ncbi:MAG: pantoate--beta-alanine ligase [Thiotrichales bacterium]|nr:MAG: pantoate--beta-alanine ligase [Thiotrichales bacterium]
MSLADDESAQTEVVDTIEQARSRIRQWKQAGQSIAFVPTMGNLHAGHLALVKAANESGMRTVVSIFVNPKQFGHNEDLDTYPRTFDEDIAALSAYRVDMLFAPDAAEIYPQGADATTSVHVRGLSDMLEGECRPGFFIGVATVVNILFNVIEPDVAWFGEKDYQQLLVIRKMVQDMALPIAIKSVPTVREGDGLAMSSRNSYLTDQQRKLAVNLYACLQHVVDQIIQGVDYTYAVVHANQELTEAGFLTDYIVVRRQEDLGVPGKHDKSLIVLGAARLDGTRLIDNIPFELMK